MNGSKLPIFLALDLEDEVKALEYAQTLSSFILGFKVGPRLYFKSSSSFLKNLSQYGEIFLDFKFHDIPSTMEASVKACFDLGVQYLTVHACAGVEALKRVAEVEKKYTGRVLAVSVLTSSQLDTKNDSDATIKRVLQLGEDVHKSGLSGFVCSAFELFAVKQQYPDFFIVTPGIRLNSSFKDDQKRVTTPKKALALGASALVMGRSLLQAQDPLSVIRSLQNG